MPNLTTTAVAARLGVTQARVRQMILAGQLKAAKQGRDWLIDERSLKSVAVRKAGRPRRKG